MSQNLSRRTILKATAGGGLAVAAMASPIFGRDARAQSKLVAVEWGGPFIEAARKVTEMQKDATVDWELHAGGAAAILPKIKAAWPNPAYDVVSAWDPVFVSMAKEGWLEPLTPDELPNMADIGDTLFYRDDKGNVINAPRNIAGMWWGARSDIAPIEINSLDDLLKPELKGQICWPDPIMNTNLQLLSLALHGGGDERNMDPGWEFLKQLAASGNIGRVAHTEVDFINSLTSGETSVAFWNMAPWIEVARHFPVRWMHKTPGDKGMKFFIYQEGYTILNSSKNKEAAKKYVNFCISPEANTAFSAITGEPPANSKATPPDAAKELAMTPDEMKQFAYVPDFGYISTQVDAMSRRFEQDIVPLL